MLRLDILVGLALVAVSVVYRIVSGGTSFTIWIPAILGGVMALCGLWAGQGGGAAAVWGVRVVAAVGAAACVAMVARRGLHLESYAQQAQILTAILCAYMLLRSWRS